MLVKTVFMLKSLEIAPGELDGKHTTHRPTDIATYRLSQPMGRFSDNCLQRSVKEIQFLIG